jgi:hypothetical protein
MGQTQLRLSGIPKERSPQAMGRAEPMLFLPVCILLDCFSASYLQPKSSRFRWNVEESELISNPDLNGDGRAEYIEIHLNTSAITVYMNGCQS